MQLYAGIIAQIRYHKTLQGRILYGTDQGNVHKENVKKADNFYISDLWVSFRTIPNLADEENDIEIKAAKQHLSATKQVV